MLLLSFIIYSNTLNYSYTWDDALVITNNNYTKAGFKGLKDILTNKGFLHNRDVYRPVPQSIYAITYQVAPNNPSVAHKVNVITYSLAIVITFWFLITFFNTKNSWLLFFITLLFALHPVHTEVVANIKSLDEILAYLFSLLSLIFFIKFLKNHFLKELVLAIIFFSIALLSKISAITVLPIFILLVWYDYQNFSLLYFQSHSFFKKLLDLQSPLSTKALSILVLFFILLSFIFIEYITLFLIIPIVVFSLLFFKNNSNFIKTVLLFLIISLLFILGYQISIFYFSIALAYFLLRKDSKSFKIYLFLLLLFFISTLFLMPSLESLFFASLWSLTPFVFLKKNKKISLVYLFAMWALILIFKRDINVISITLVLLTIFFLLVKRKEKKYLFISLFIISILFDLLYFNKQGILQKEILPKNITLVENNKEVIQSMSPLNNTLYSENNKEIKFATIAKIQLKYLQLLVFPHPLIHQYGFNQITKTTFKDWKVGFSIILHLLLFLFALYKLKDKSPIAFGILFYLSTISIYTNIVVLMPDTLAERFLFTPSLGFIIAFVFFLDFIIKKLKFKKENLVLFILLLPVFIAFAYKTFDRNKAWKNNLELARQTIKYAKNNAAINAQYASELYNHQLDSQKVFYHYNRALEIYPNFYSANKDLATFFITKNKPSKAEKYLLKCIELKPNDWESYCFLGFIEYDKKYYDKAVPYFENSLDTGYDKMPKEKLIYASEFLARCYFNTHQIQKADDLLKNIYREYKAKSSIILLGNIYHQFGKTQKAIDTYIFLQKDFPNDDELRNTIEILKKKLNH